MRKIFDCFTFFNELDLLEIRLNELNDVVDYFVVVEGTKTFQNNPKPNYYLENIDRFKKFASKIIRVEIPENEFTNDAWDNEKMSRNNIIKGLHIAKEDDIIIISALDEIPKNESILQITTQESNFPVCVNTRMFYFYLNTQYSLENFNGEWSVNWRGPYVTTYNLLNKDNPYNFINERKCVPLVGEGWHYSFLGDASNAYKKTHSYSHSENNHISEEEYNIRRNNLEDVFGRHDVKFDSIIENKCMPKYVQDNLEKFSKYIRK